MRLRLAIVIAAALATALLLAAPAAQGAAAQGTVAQGGIGVVLLPPPGTCLVAVCVEVSVSVTGNGGGRITSSPAGIDCVVRIAEGVIAESGTCSYQFRSDTLPLRVRVSATPDPGSSCDPCTHEVVAERSLDEVLSFGFFELPSDAGDATGGGQAGGGAQADTTVEAELVDVNVSVKRQGRLYVIRVELALEEEVSASLRLVRGSKTLRQVTSVHLDPGERYLYLRLGSRAAPAWGTLVLELADGAGNTLVLGRRVQLRPQARAAAVVGRAGGSDAVCGTFQAGGATWGAKTTGVSCATARRIVRRLAGLAAPLPGGRYPGRYEGMTCGGLVPGSKPRMITCQGDGRQIVAGRKP